MKLSRLEELYQRKLARSEASPKVLPLEHILKQKVSYYPQKPDSPDYDIVEIGPGTGDFLFHLAETYPQKKIAGIEIGGRRFEKIKTRLLKRGIKNVTLIHGDARVPFHLDFKSETFEKCFVLFPDPWPRNKHRHLRLLQIDFLKLICEKLKPDGEFTLATDVRDYALWVMDNFKQIESMRNDFGDGVILTELDEIIPTFFKKKWDEMGRKFHYLRFSKKSHSTN